jgi:hypothetical protein
MASTAILGVVVVLTSQAYIWYVEKSKRSHDNVERSFGLFEGGNYPKEVFFLKMAYSAMV